jgi:CDP-glucose 4,6-dehydratase
LELTNKILRLMRSDLEPVVQGIACHEIRHQYLSAEKARTMLHWKPLFTFDEGLKRTIEWYQNFLEPACSTLTLPAGRAAKSA